MKTSKKIILSIICVLVILTGYFIYREFFSPTKIAFVNFQTITLGQISKANDNARIRLKEIGTEELEKLRAYDMVFVNGMGLRVIEEQRALIQKAADKGVPVYTTMATNPVNNITNLDSLQLQRVGEYLAGGGKKNYRSLLNYIRKEIDRKRFSVEDAEAVVTRSSDYLYHNGIKDPEEEYEFADIKAYEDFLKKEGLWKPEGKKAVITGQMADPSDLIHGLEESGINVYPISSRRKFEQFLEEINPDAVINLPHGRLGDRMVEFLQQKNIPLFAPLTVNSLIEDWENNPMGMSGGFLSQSVVTPEIDGAIRSFTLFAQYKDKDGLHHSFAIPERLATFINCVHAYLNLKEKKNSEKRVAIYYFKGPGQNAMTARGMEVAPSLYNLLKRLKSEGYRVDNLPANHRELEKMIMSQGAVFGNYAEGAFDEFMRNGKPELVDRTSYKSWVRQSLRPEKYAEVLALHGEFPGDYMATEDGKIGVARLQFGNIVLLPQNAAGAGSNSFQVVHGTDAAPPHTYIASYLWMQHGFKADALIHFGTHGSLEFTPKKQVALSSNDWPDRLVGVLPHFYIYSIGNVGEGIIAKRRSYAGLQSYLTPPFLESSVRGIYRELMEEIKVYNNNLEELYDENRNQSKEVIEGKLRKAALKVKSGTIRLGIHRELGLDSIPDQPYNEEEILRIENFAEELATEKITGQLYTMGVPYESERILSSLYAMATEPIAYSLLALDKQRGKADDRVAKHKSLFTQRYLNPARQLVADIMKQPSMVNESLVCRVAGVTPEQLEEAKKIVASKERPGGMMAMMMGGATGMPSMADMSAMAGMAAGKNTSSGKTTGPATGGKPQMPEAMRKGLEKMTGGDTAMINKIQGMMNSMNTETARKMMSAMRGKESAKKPEAPAGKTSHPAAATHPGEKTGTTGEEYTREDVNFAMALLEVERTIKNINNYRQQLQESPEKELSSMLNALGGGYTAPSPGGDLIANPNTLPTGRNLYAINAEATPSESAWDKGIKLATNTIELYRKRHDGEYPRKVSYTLWSGEFIETEGATIAQILYMLGVEPVRDAFGRVNDLRLIPSEELGRPRIDVVVQTSGQLRDLAASRLFLVNRAVEMAAAAKEDEYENMVTASVVESERLLMEKGLSPKDAREMSTFRVFGGANGGYGTGIQGMVESGDRWEEESEIARTYLNNMGAYYGNEKNWEAFRQFAFESALTRTDVVIQPRQSNTWGALSLDHVYEFMGGLNLSVRHVTGKDPDAYFSDYRNRNNVRMQELKESIGVESRTTLLNPTYIKEKMKGEASSAGVFAETIRNTYGWNVMKPSAIDNELWNEIYNVYVKDQFELGVEAFFKKENPAALEEITAVMMETIRKGYWKASEQQIADISRLHTDLVREFKPSCSGFVCDNAKLRDFIASKTDIQSAREYKEQITKIREASIQENEKSIILKKEEQQGKNDQTEENKGMHDILIAFAGIALFIVLIFIIRKNRRKTA